MDCLIILGRNPALSLAELTAVFGCSIERVVPEIGRIAALPMSELEAIERFARLGGSVKLGVADAVVETKELDRAIAASLLALLQEQRTGKIQIGASIYSGTNALRHHVGKILLSMKNISREQGRSLRVVVSKDPNLSSVVVEKNHLLDRGREFLLLAQPIPHDTGPGSLIVGHTIAVQDFEAQSRRDYGRPRRDPRRGMLPIQLARVMVNMAAPNVGATVLDPFCGIGTVLQEALLLGHDVIGADIDPRAISDARANLQWLTEGIKKKDLRIMDRTELITADVRALPEQLRGRRVDAIVTELDLGPAVRGRITRHDVEAMRETLLPLYRDAFQAFARLLKPGRRAVVALPAWRVKDQTIFSVDDLTVFTNLGFELPVTHYQLPQRHTFLYGRPDQTVWREIVVVERS